MTRRSMRILMFIGSALIGCASIGCAQTSDEAETPLANVAEVDSTAGPAWGEFDVAMKNVEASEDNVLVFVYTDWCGWCRKMTDDVFTDPAILTYLEENYEVVRVNAEGLQEVKVKDRVIPEAQLAQALGATGFPTTVFLNSQGEIITELSGFKPADEYLKILKYIGEDAYKDVSFADYLSAAG